jgi:PmbA protein
MHNSDLLLSLADLSDRAEYLLGKIKSQGMDQAEVDVSSSVGFSVSARQGKCDSLEQNIDQSLSLTIYNNHCVSTVNSTDLAYAALDKLVDKVVSQVKFVQQDEHNGLATASELAFDYPELDLYHPADLTVSAAVELAIEMDHIATQEDQRILHTDSCVVGSSEHICYYANSFGFAGHYKYTRHNLSHSVIAQDESGKQNYGDYDVRCMSSQLESPQQLAQRVAVEACRKLQSRVVKTQRCPVLFSPPVAKKLFMCFLSAINGHRIYQQSSFLRENLGELIFPESFSLKQYPHRKRSLFSSPFDDEGVRTREQAFLQEGRFHQFICDSYAARRLGTAVTGNAGGLFNVCLEAPTVSLEELVKQMHSGLIVTDVMGQGVNMVNGDYSKGASGFWVENGSIQYPVEKVTIASNLRAMFASIVAAGNDIDDRGNLHLGSILVEGMTVSGN